MRYFLVAQYTYCKYTYIHSVYIHTIYNTVAYKKMCTSILWILEKLPFQCNTVGVGGGSRPHGKYLGQEDSPPWIDQCPFYILVWCCEVDFLLCFALFLPFFVEWYKETTFQSLELWDNISNKIPNFNYFVMKHASTSSFHFVFLTSVFFKKMIFQKYLQK